jgi:hypothetical protein
MRSLSILAITCLTLCPSIDAAESADPILLKGLTAWVENGADAGLRTWYSDRPALAFQMKEKLLPAISDLGTVIDSEVVAIQPISQRVTRYYVVVYFTHAPLWMRVERYASDITAFYLPLKFSTDPDRILPGYITEFQF